MDDETQGSSGVIREQPTPEPSRAALVKQLCGEVREARKHWQPVWDRMREDMRFCAGQQWPAGSSKDAYVANVTQRAVNQKVASLYAKNPKAVARRREKIDFTLWDEDPATLQQAQAAMMAFQSAPFDPMNPGMALQPPIEAMAVLADYEEGMKRRRTIDAVGRTLELLFKHQTDTQDPPFKGQMKDVVRRAVTTGVGFLRLGYRREQEATPPADPAAWRTGVTARAQALAQRLADVSDGETAEDQAPAEELRLLALQLAADLAAGGQTMVTTSEGLTFTFPQATSIIVDPGLTNLRGFQGARWVAQEFLLSAEKIQQEYGVDVRGAGGTTYFEGPRGHEPSTEAAGQAKGKDGKFCVWELWDKGTQLRYVLCDGYPDFLAEPETPQPALKRFWPLFPLTLNPAETEESDPEKHISPFPQSDVRLIMPLQREINRSREALRKHRVANRPKYAVAAGRLSAEDKDKLICHPDNAVIEIQGLAPGEKVSDVLQPIPTVPIDPAVYGTEHVMQDMLSVIGAQEANLGPTAGKTATESSIAESSRLTSTGSNVDDIDDFLSEVAEAAGEILLTEMSAATVKQIVGPGAAWPELRRDEIQQELYLEVEAASTGRPNRNLEVSNFAQLAPLLMQIPGVNVEWLAKEGAKRLDDRMDFTQVWRAGSPSVEALNRSPALALGPGAPPEQEAGPGGPPPGGGQMPLRTQMPAQAGNAVAASPNDLRNRAAVDMAASGPAQAGMI